MAGTLSVALIGTGFMGRAHSNAWLSVNRFFEEAPLGAVMHTLCGRDAETAGRFARRWGWQRATADLDEALDGAVDLVDVTTPNDLHARHAVAALRAGKHVACEKPLAGTLADARAMRDAAREAAARGAGAWVWFNYRRCPAIAYARRLVAEGRLGQIYHVRAQYLQDWGGPATPRSWRFDAGRAGSGALGDLGAHAVDMARFVTGDEVAEVVGGLEARFVEDRPAPGAAGRREPSTVDDCVLFTARLASGAVASFEATRLATGNLNRNRLEINGASGALRFDFERMNELEWFDAAGDAGRRGWTTITCTDPAEHPYVGAYWPPGHPLGYEHQFVSQAADIITAVSGGTPVVPLPDFEDAYRTQLVLHAALRSARSGRPVTPAEIDDG